MAKIRQRVSSPYSEIQKGGKVPQNPGKSFSDPHSANGGKGINASFKEMSRGGKDGSNLNGYFKGDC